MLLKRTGSGTKGSFAVSSTTGSTTDRIKPSSTSFTASNKNDDIFSASSIIQGNHLAPSTAKIAKLMNQSKKDNQLTEHLHFSIAIRFSDTGEVIELANVSKFWTVGDVSRRVLKLRHKMQEQKMGLPGVYFPEDQERILMKYKEEDRLATLQSMESSLKQKYFYSPARDEIEQEKEEDDEDEQRNSASRTSHQHNSASSFVSGRRRSSLMQPTASSASKALFTPSPSPNTGRHYHQQQNNNDESVPVSQHSSARVTTVSKKTHEYGANYKSPYAFSDGKTTKRTIGGQQDESQFFRFHRASDFANERLNGNKSDVNGDGPWMPPSGGALMVTKSGFAEKRKAAQAGTSASSSSSASTSSTIRLSQSGQFFNDPHETLEDLGITYEETMKRKRAGEGNLIQVEAEVVQNLIFGRAIVKRM